MPELNPPDVGDPMMVVGGDGDVGDGGGDNGGGPIE